MAKKVLFIYPGNEPSYPLQIAALSAYIKKHGHSSRLISLLIDKGLEDKHYALVKTAVEETKPDYVAFSAYEMAFPWIERISKHLKENYPGIKIIVGGYYPTLAPQEVIKNPYIDVICIGEGEFPLKELLDAPEGSTQIQNLWFKKGEEIIKNPVRPLFDNLDELPYPDREMLDYQAQLDQDIVGERTVKVMATRGCPYQCTYCSNKYLRGVYPNQEKYLRFRTPENVIAEIKVLKEKYKFEKVGFHDDNLTLDLDWLKKFCQLYKKEINLPFYCATRVERCGQEILELLKDAGCYLMLLGIESGNEKYRKDMMKRFMSNQTIVDAFRRARKLGILTWSFTMVGLPDETKRMVLDTLILNLKCRPDFVMASIFYPLKGTELGDLCYRNGWVNFKKKEEVNSYAWETILNHPYLSPIEIKIAKYINTFTAVGSPFFWKLVMGRIHQWFIR